MDFALSPSLEALLARTRELMDAHVYPLEPVVAEKGFVGARAELLAAREACRRAGLWLPQMPEELGGMGLPFLEHAHMSEVLGRSLLGHYVFNCQAPDAGNMELLLEQGTEEQKDRFLKPLCAGQIRSCFSMTEPDRAGSNPTWLDTTATLEDGMWVINGRKWFTTAADGADFAIVMAVTEPDALPHQRASMILVPTSTPGFEHTRRIPIMGEEGSGWMSHSEITYRDCRVPEGNLLGGRGQGFLLAQHRLGPGRIHHCMRWIGLCERAFDLMCARAATRELAPGKPLGTRQMVQDWIATSRAEIDAARLYVQKAAWTIDQKGLYAARTEISCIKFFVANVLQQVVDRAIQTHGALGITEDTPLSAIFRHERGARIYDGPDEVHKYVVARRALKAHGLELGGGG
ncbi:MAG: acyl-CoA dehydrogenase family protein [Myxococcales bacterium]|nr:acyl-CoA dehydrogenase family protein [Myxococcales bacterium]